jgi:hypothetical protein
MTDTININLNPSTTQYHVTLKPYLRLFLGNSSGRSLGVWNFDFNQVNEFMNQVWDKAVPHLSRGVNLETNADGVVTCSWMPDFPALGDINMFVEIFDVQSKRKIQWHQIDGPKLQYMTNREIKVFIYKYASNLDCRENYECAKRTLMEPSETDRSGAATIEIMNNMVDRLKALHQDQLDAFDISWGLWANDILEKPVN